MEKNTKQNIEHYLPHYETLFEAYNCAQVYGKCKNGYEFIVDDGFYIPDKLSDEDKFICALFHLYNTEIGLTSEELKKYYGWSSYKSKKIRKNISFVETCTLLDDNRHYSGKGWQLSNDMYGEIVNDLSSKRPSCAGCALNRKSFICKYTGEILTELKLTHG